MILTYREMAQQLFKAVVKGYKGGLSAMVRQNKKTILKLDDKSGGLFNVSYTAEDKAMIQNFIVEAFTVAGVNSYECEEKLKEMAAQILNGDHPYMKAHPESDAKSLWIDEAYSIIADYIQVIDMPPPSVLNTNLRTAVTSSYMASQWTRLQDLKDIYTYYQYKTREDNRVRQSHRVLDNKIFSANDPIWDTIYPPNGWNCRCYVNALDQSELQAANPDDIVNMDGQQLRQQYIAQANVSPQFSRNSGQTGSIWGKWIKQKLTGKAYDEINQRMKDLAEATRQSIDTPVEKFSEINLSSLITIKPGLNEDAVKNVKNVLNNANEIWGEAYNYSNRQHEIIFIKYTLDGFDAVKVNKAEAYEFSSNKISDLDKFRIGVLMSV